MIHAPVLHVIIPMLLAPFCALLKNGTIAWRVTTSVMILLSISSYFLLQYIAENGTIFYSLGGWQPPIGIGYRIDVLSAFMVFLISLIGAITAFYSHHNIMQEIAPERQPLTYTIFLLCVAGLIGMCVSNDLFNIYVFLEISSLATYSLIALGINRRSYLAAFHYLILGTIGATFYLIGIGFFYAHTGTLNLSDLARLLPQPHPIISVDVGLGFMMVGILLKTAIFPMHMWLVRSYHYAPTFASAFLSSTATKVALYLLIRVLYVLAIPIQSFLTDISILTILIWLGTAAVMVGTIATLIQKDIRRFLAFSSIAHIGYICISISVATQQGLVVAITHMINHAVAKSALFMGTGILLYYFQRTFLSDMKGLYHRNPTLSIGIAIGLASLTGLPLTAGLISKWILIELFIEEQYWLLIILILIASLIAIIAAWRIIEPMFMQKPDNKTVLPTLPLSLTIGFWLMILLNIGFGLNTTLTYNIGMQAAIEIFGVAP